MSSIVERTLSFVPGTSLRTERRFMLKPLSTQERLLRSILERARGTEWGRRLDFAGALGERDVVAAYQSRVELHHYEDIRDDVERVRGGAVDVMWPGSFRHFAVSSGTASAGKIIPVSHEMLVSNRNFSVGVAIGYLARYTRPGFLAGKHLTLPGRIEEDPNYPGTLVGEVSGLQAEYAPAYFRRFYQAIPNEVAFLPNWERKLDAIVDRTLDMDIRMLVMAPTWALVFFKQLVQRYRERSGKSVETVGEIWPNLQLFISGGVALSSYRDLLQAQIGLRNMHFLETYGASEGFFSFQTDLEDPSMVLHLDNGVFYEFVRRDEMSEANPRRYTLRDVEAGVPYAMYVSTCSGLWSYGVKDVVRFSSVRPYKIVVAGRTSDMLDLYGEAMYGDEARKAMETAVSRTGNRVREFHVAPRRASSDRLPAHQWLVEFENPPSDTGQFAAELDAYLQEVNRHYQIRREARAFDAPEVVVLREGTFYAWLKQTRDRLSGQTKVPMMSEERTVSDGVLRIADDAR